MRERVHLRPERGHVCRRIEHGQVIARFQNLAWLSAQSRDQFGRRRARHGRARREIEVDDLTPPFCGQRAAAGLKPDTMTGVAQLGKKNKGSGQGGVTAQINFHHGREPAQLIILLLPREKSCLGEVVLRGDVL